MKRLVLCFDGTWVARASREKRSGDFATNVEKTHIAVKKRDAQGTLQVTAYYRGIGTRGLGVWGGMTGSGISDTICDAYAFIVDNFELGQDELYFFGFSRGAYTARSLSGFMEWIGVVDKPYLCNLPYYYEQYRLPEDRRDDSVRGTQLQEIRVGDASIPIRFLGVWDTVGSLGVPVPVVGRLVNRKRLVGFHNTNLSKKVSYAYQALAIHEHRKNFAPSLWPDKANAIEMEQAWFAGTHSDVGGGNKDRNLSNIAWKWMLCKAEALGLEFDQKYLTSELKSHDVTGLIFNSNSGGWWLAPRQVRTFGSGFDERRHHSVDQRLVHFKAHPTQRQYVGKAGRPPEAVALATEGALWRTAEESACLLPLGSACPDDDVNAEPTPDELPQKAMKESEELRKATQEKIDILNSTTPTITFKGGKPMKT